jgi:sporulation protein YlmC with PRC-barrel domain
MRYHELVGKQVITADGERIGRVVDLMARKRGEALCVTALLLGKAGLVERIGIRHLRRPRVIAWEDVARIGKQVELRAGAAIRSR